MDHTSLLRVIETCDCKQFLEWYENGQQECYSTVKECIDRLSNKELSAIWTVMSRWVTSSLQKVVTQDTSPDDKEYEMKMIGTLANMAILTIDNVSLNEPIKLISAVKAMNETLDAITNKKTGKQICDMSEKYWKKNPELEVDMSLNAVRWLLTQASHPSTTATSIKQVWNLKNSIEKWDQNQLKDSGVLNILLSCIRNSKFLACPEGRKCLALLFHFGSTVVQATQQVVKQYIPLSNVADCEAIGDVYFKAWRMALSEQSRADVEFAIQDVMYNAVVAFREPLGEVESGINKIAMNKLLFHLLHAIHRQKKQRTVAILLYNLYKPILWRYLEASNGLVRANALNLFFDAFPFETGEGAEEDEALNEKQWVIIKTALLDPVPLVRTIAVQGTCRMLAEYWEIVPVNIVQDFITCLLRKLLLDSASVDVRASVVKGLTVMLANNQTYGLLVKMLPHTKKVLHDPSEKVRSEYVHLLTIVQKLKVSKLWEIIDVNHVVLRLETDSSKTVCRKLTTLLQPFFHPKSTPDIVFQRCLHLVMENRKATRKFYQNLHICVGIQQIAELIMVIWKFLRNFVLKKLRTNREKQQSQEEEPQPQQKSRGTKRSLHRVSSESESSCDERTDSDSRVSTGDEDDINDEDEVVNESTIMGLIDVVCILLHENKTKFKTPQNLIYWNNIKARFNKTCSLFFRYFRSSDGLRSLIFLYGLFSSSSSQHLFTFVKSQLKALDSDATSLQFAHLIDVMCNWDRGDDLIEIITEHFQTSLNVLFEQNQSEENSREGVKPRKRVSFQRLADEKPLLGLRFLQYVLQNPQNKKQILRRNLTQVENLNVYLKRVFELLEQNSKSLGSNETLLFTTATTYVKLLLVLNCTYKREKVEDKYDFTQMEIANMFEWAARIVNCGEPPSVIVHLIDDMFSATYNILLVHAVKWEACSKMIHVMSLLIDKVPSLEHILMALKLAHLLIRFIFIEQAIDKEISSNCEGEILALIKLVVNSSWLDQCTTDSLTEQDWNRLRKSFKQLLTPDFLGENQQAFRCIVDVMFCRVRKDMRNFQPKLEEPVCKPRDFPVFPGIVVASLIDDNLILDRFLEFLIEPLKDIDNSETIIGDLALALQMYNFLRKNEGLRSKKEKLDQILECIEEFWSQVGDVCKSAKEELAHYIDETLKELQSSISL